MLEKCTEYVYINVNMNINFSMKFIFGDDNFGSQYYISYYISYINNRES